MHIKIGFDIQLAVTSPMALIYLLHVHPSRQADLWAPEVVWVQPNLFVDEYLDTFGNQCGRVNAFAGVSQVRFYKLPYRSEGLHARQAQPVHRPGSPCG